MDDGQRSLLQAIAHPVRLEVFDTLQSAPAPLSESQILKSTLGGRSGIRSHLRALESVGLARMVEPGMWVAVQRPVVVPAHDELEPGDPDRALVDRLHRLFADRRLARIKEWNRINVRPEWEPWRRYVVAHDWTMCMSREQLADMEEDLVAVVRKHRELIASEGPLPECEAVYVSLFAAPLNGLRPLL